MPSEFLKLTIEDRAEIFNEIFRIKNLNPIAVEKDWWVNLQYLIQCRLVKD